MYDDGIDTDDGITEGAGMDEIVIVSHAVDDVGWTSGKLVYTACETEIITYYDDSENEVGKTDDAVTTAF